MGGAVVIARMAAKNKPEEEDAPAKEVQASDIFVGLPEEEPPPPPGGDGSKRMVNVAPANLDQHADFQRARELAEQAGNALDSAKKAKAEGDHATWNTKATYAKNLYDEAVTITALWEEELLEKYGDRDRQVKAIMDERSRWFKMLTTLHKTTGRE